MNAFISAFAPDFKDVRFVLKVSNLNKFPASQKEILGLQARYPAISVIDEYLTRDEVMDLMAAADVYVSLHAAEGYGLTLLEAMAVGTPVICTAYSGNMDFTNGINSWLVGYEMMRTDERTGPYPEGSIWASPKLEDAIVDDATRRGQQIRDRGEGRARPSGRLGGCLPRAICPAPRRTAPTRALTHSLRDQGPRWPQPSLATRSRLQLGHAPHRPTTLHNRDAAATESRLMPGRPDRVRPSRNRPVRL